MPAPATPAPLDPPIAPFEGDTLAWTLPVLENFAEGLGLTVTYDQLAPGQDGSHQPTIRAITVNRAISGTQQAVALVHELAHALVHLDRKNDDPEFDYALEELVAESARS